jgi:cytochrome c biogenesis protein CcmG/thiol:disulfide interchange protein DsbE
MVLVDQEGRAGLDLGITGAPETFAVNAMGEVVAKFTGPLVDDAEVERLVAAIQAPARPLPTAAPRDPGR